MSEESRAMRAPNALRRPNKFVAYMRKYWFVYMPVSYTHLLDELLAQSDVISLHCPLFPDTQGIINRESIAKMKDGCLLYTSRCV